jgi:hypothetical protein
MEAVSEWNDFFDEVCEVASLRAEVKRLRERALRAERERDAIEGVAVELRRFQCYGYREDDEAFRSSREDVRKAAGLNVPAGEGGAP